jgi:Secretion system C-terminal sorting domain
MKKSIFLLICSLFCSLSYTVAQIHWGSLWLENQWQLDTLQRYDSIAGSVIIGKLPPAISDIRDLSKLASWKAIQGDLDIIGTSLTNLNGLDSLTDVGSHVVTVSGNQYLKNLDGLGNIRFDYKDFCCEFYINANAELERLTKFNNLDTTFKRIQIANNPKLATLKGLEELRNPFIEIDGGIFKTLDGLQGGLGANIRVINNDSLISIRDFRPTQHGSTVFPNVVFYRSSGLRLNRCAQFTGSDYLSSDYLANTSLGFSECSNLRSVNLSIKMQNVGFGASSCLNLESVTLTNFDTLKSLVIRDNPELKQIKLTDNRVLGGVQIAKNPKLKTLLLPGGDPADEPSDELKIPYLESDGKQFYGGLTIEENDSLISIAFPDFNVRTDSELTLKNNKQLEYLYAPKFSPTRIIQVRGNNFKKLELPGIYGKLAYNIQIHQSSTDTINFGGLILPSTNDIDSIIGIGNYQSVGRDVEIWANARHVSEFKQEYVNADTGINHFYQAIRLVDLKVDQLRFPNLRKARGWVSTSDLSNLKTPPKFSSLDKQQNFELGIYGSPLITSIDSLQYINTDSIHLRIELPQLTDCDVLCQWRAKGYHLDYFAFNGTAPCNDLQNIYQFCTINTNEPALIPVEVYPNPAGAILNVLHKNEMTQLWLINAQGDAVRWLEPKQETAQMQLTDLPGGVYYLFGQDEKGGTFQRKVVVLGQ